MKDKKGIFRDTAHFTLSNYITQAIGMVTAVVVRRGLGPAFMGIWELVKIVIRYGEYSDLGISSVAVRDIPYHMSKNEEKEALLLKDVSFSYTIGVAIIMALAIMVFSWFNPLRFSGDLVTGLQFAGLILILTSLYSFYINMMRAYKNFVVLSRLIVLNSVLVLLLVLFLVPRFKILGVYISLIVTLLLCCLYAFLKTGYSLKFGFNASKFYYIVKTGIPIFLSGAGLTLLMSIDKIMIAKMLSFKQLGYYTIGSMVVPTLYLLPKSFGIVIFPRIQEELGKATHISEVKSYLVEPIKYIMFFMPLLIGITYFVIPVIVRFILPQYTEGITAFKISVVGVFFLCLAYPGYIFMISLNRQVLLAVILGIASLFSFLATWYIIKLGFGLEGVAFCMDLSYFLYFLLVYQITLKKVLLPGENRGLFFLTLFSFCYFLFSIIVIDKFIFIKQFWVQFFVQSGLYLISAIGILFYWQKKGYLPEKVISKLNLFAVKHKR